MADPRNTVIQRNAEWADTFGGASTNLAQRHRYAQDQETYAQELVNQQETEMQRRLATDKGERDLYFRQQNLVRQNTRDQFEMGLKEEAHKMKERLFPLEMKAKEATIRATLAREEAVVKDTLRKAEMAERVERDTDGFNEEVFAGLEKGAGSQEFADVVAKAALKYKYVPAAMRKEWFDQADIDLDPEQMLKESAKLAPEQRGNVSFALNANGKWSMRFAPEKPAAPEKFGTTTTSTKADGTTTTSTTRPLTGPAAPAAGEVRGGWRFKGGNPADKSNWEK